MASTSDRPPPWSLPPSASAPSARLRATAPPTRCPSVAHSFTRRRRHCSTTLWMTLRRRTSSTVSTASACWKSANSKTDPGFPVRQNRGNTAFYSSFFSQLPAKCLICSNTPLLCVYVCVVADKHGAPTSAVSTQTTPTPTVCNLAREFRH